MLRSKYFSQTVINTGDTAWSLLSFGSEGQFGGEERGEEGGEEEEEGKVCHHLGREEVGLQNNLSKKQVLKKREGSNKAWLS